MEACNSNFREFNSSIEKKSLREQSITINEGRTKAGVRFLHRRRHSLPPVAPSKILCTMPAPSRPSRGILDDEDLPYPPVVMTPTSQEDPLGRHPRSTGTPSSMRPSLYPFASGSRSVHPSGLHSRPIGTPSVMRPARFPFSTGSVIDYTAPLGIHSRPTGTASAMRLPRILRTPGSRIDHDHDTRRAPPFRSIDNHLNGRRGVHPENPPNRTMHGVYPTNHRGLSGGRGGSMPPSCERPTAPRTLNDLEKAILGHPLLPLVFCGVYKASTGNTPFIPGIRTQNSLSKAASNGEHLECFARQVGITEACSKVQSLDVFMCGMVTALNSLNSPRAPSIPSFLHDIIRACGNQPGFPVLRPLPVAPNPSPSTPLPYSHVSAPLVNEHFQRFKTGGNAKEYLERWFVEHLDYPYPTDSQKKQIARDTNLQLSQVNNWFGKFF